VGGTLDEITAALRDDRVRPIDQKARSQAFSFRRSIVRLQLNRDFRVYEALHHDCLIRGTGSNAFLELGCNHGAEDFVLNDETLAVVAALRHFTESGGKLCMAVVNWSS